MGEVIVITSGKGGVGKTTTVANIGTGLAMMGKKAVVVDTDIGLRNLDVVLANRLRVFANPRLKPRLIGVDQIKGLFGVSDV